ncbi:MAG TPA: hypothetical protein VH989_01655 [Actinomycetota bacterium]|jgi:hypothetical protein
MRRLAPAAALLLALWGCAGPAGPRSPLPAGSEASPAQGIQDAAARDAAIRFIHAYATAPQDGGTALTGVVDGLASDWAHWFDVQNATFDGAVTGQASILSVGPPASTNGATPAVVVDVQASVTFTYAPSDGSSLAPQVRSLDGPMLLAQVGPYDYRVEDFTRDGQALHSFFASLAGPGTVREGIRVSVHAVIVSGATWQVGLDVRNSSASSIEVGSSNVGLFLDQQIVPGTVVSTFDPIQPGTTEEGFVTLPAPAGAGQLALVLRFGSSVEPIDFVIAIPDPREATGQSVPSSSPSPAPSGDGALAG